IRDQILSDLHGIAHNRSTIPFYSTLTASLTDTSSLDATYWYDNLRHPVQVERTVRLLAEHGHRSFLETSPHPVLTPGIQDTLPDAHVQGTLRRSELGPRRFLASLAAAHVAGLPTRWDLPGRHVDLPTYPFQPQRYWLKQAGSRRTRPTVDSLRFEVGWRQVGGGDGELSGTWLVVAPDGAAVSGLAG